MKARKNLYLIAGILVMALYSCKKNKIETGIIGTWVNEGAYNSDLVIRQTYHFQPDSTMEFTRTLIEKKTGLLIGYNARFTARFSFNGTALKQIYIDDYTVDASQVKQGDPYYTDLNKLIPLIHVTSTEIFQLQFNGDKTNFNFVYPPCPLNANCLPVMIFYKQ